MTQRDQLIEALAKHLDRTATNQELQDDLGFPSASIRRLTGTLTKKGILERVDRGTYRLEQLYEHYVSSLFYCGGKKHVYYIKTYTTKKINLREQLRETLIEETESMCSEPREDYGYSVDLTDEIDISILWDEYEFGEEN